MHQSAVNIDEEGVFSVPAVAPCGGKAFNALGARLEAVCVLRFAASVMENNPKKLAR
jgi:hypothetical protein